MISTPNLAGLESIASLLLGLQPPTANISDETDVGNPFSPYYKSKRSSDPNYQGHRRLFTYRALKELFEYHGFEVGKIIGVGYYPFPIKIARTVSRIDPRHAACLTMKVKKKVGGKS